MINMDDWRTVMRAQVHKALARPGVEVWVAYKPGETDTRVDDYLWFATTRGNDLR
jgi:hypothetical protein